MEVPIFTIAEAWTRTGWAVNAISAVMKTFHVSWPATRTRLSERLGQRAELDLVEQILSREFCPCLKTLELQLRSLALNLRRRRIHYALEDTLTLVRSVHDLEGILLRFDSNWNELAGMIEDIAEGRGKDATAAGRLLKCIDEQEAPLRTVDRELPTLRSNARLLMDELERYNDALQFVLGSEKGFDAIGVTAVTNWSFVASVDGDGHTPRYRRPTDNRVRVRGEPSADGVASTSVEWTLTDTVRGSQGRLIRTSGGGEVLLIGDPEKEYELDMERQGLRLVNADDPLGKESLVSIGSDKR